MGQISGPDIYHCHRVLDLVDLDRWTLFGPAGCEQNQKQQHIDVGHVFQEIGRNEQMDPFVRLIYIFVPEPDIRGFATSSELGFSWQ